MPLHSLIHSPAELSRSLTHPTGHSFFDTQHREATKQAAMSLAIIIVTVFFGAVALFGFFVAGRNSNDRG